MKLSNVYNALNGLRKHQDFALSPQTSKYLQGNGLIKVIPAADYESLKESFLQYNRLEGQVDKLSQERDYKDSEADLIRGNLNSFLYKLFKTKDTLNAKSQELSKLEKELTLLDEKIAPKQTEMKSKEKIVNRLERKYNIEDYDDLRGYSKNGHGYIALTAFARDIMPLIRKELKEKPNKLYETFKEDLKRILGEKRREDSGYSYTSSRRRDDDDDDDDHHSHSNSSFGFGIGGFGSGGFSGGGFGGGGFSGGGGSFGGGGASGKW